MTHIAQTRLDLSRGLGKLFEHLPDVSVWAKDRNGRFIHGNLAVLRLLGLSQLKDLIGRRDRDFFPAYLCESYARDDEHVAATGQALVDRIEPMRDADGRFSWQNTTKIPLLNRRGEVVAVAGFTRSLKPLDPPVARFETLGAAVEVMMNRYGEPLTVAMLASRVHLSVSQFERRFVQHFGVTPMNYLAQVRVAAAKQLLVDTDSSLADIAVRTGHCDQSHFSHRFTRHTGISPGRYRLRFSLRNLAT